MKRVEANGVYVWYYCICKREVWLMARGIVPDQKDENIDLGRFIHENYYKRDDKEISFGNVRFDVVFQSKEKVVIGETKKSSTFYEASKYQLLFYLRVMRQAGINASGILLYPEERRRVEVELDDDSEKELDDICADIERIISREAPPKVRDNKYCKSCGYRMYCYA